MKFRRVKILTFKLLFFFNVGELYQERARGKTRNGKVARYFDLGNMLKQMNFRET